MTLKIDKAGRIVLPKPIRERWGLRAGMNIEVTEGSEGLTLKPAAKQPSLVREGRFLVHTGKLPPGYDIVHALREDREERIRKQSGL